MAVTEKNTEWKVFWQAHQSTNTEVPENTMAAMQYAWKLGGIPEIDIRQTADRVIIGMHDSTPSRTAQTLAPEDQLKQVNELTFEQIQSWDAGIKFGEKFRGEKVPSLKQVLDVLSEHPEREVYLDYKNVDLENLAAQINQSGVARQIIFTHCDHENCIAMKRLVPELRTMMWVTGKDPEKTARRFEEAKHTGFDSLDIIQFHLVDEENAQSWRYKVKREFVETAFKTLRDAGRELEVLPYHLDQKSLFELLDIGVRRFAVDQPSVFVELLSRYR